MVHRLLIAVGGFPGCRAQALGMEASEVAARTLGSSGPQAVISLSSFANFTIQVDMKYRTQVGRWGAWFCFVVAEETRKESRGIPCFFLPDDIFFRVLTTELTVYFHKVGFFNNEKYMEREVAF